MTAGDVTQYSAIDGWTVEIETEGPPLRLSLRGAFVIAGRLAWNGVVGWWLSIRTGEL